jgi:hypothetical protein
MSRSVSNAKQPRVQKICTIWTHDDNFSKEELVFNAEKFPELPTAPGTLLQIVGLDDAATKRDQKHETQTTSDGASKDTGEDGHVRKARRGSISVTVEENGSTVPGGREIDAEKAYVFVARALPADLKSKYPNLQVSGAYDHLATKLTHLEISISERIAKVFGFRNRMQVIVAEVCRK